MNQNFEKPNEFWKLCESYTLLEAALLILDIDPEGNENIERKSEKPKGLAAILASLNSAVKNGTLEADEPSPSAKEMLAGNKQYLIIDANNLKDWLRTKNFTTGFLFDNKDLPIRTPDYLNKDHPNYAYKLAAAVRAWEAVSTDKKYQNNGRRIKTNLVNYLKSHASNLDLLKQDGEINNTAIEEQIAMIANWEPTGGISKTPTKT